MFPNILSVLEVSSKEDVITNLLRYCLEAAPSFRNIFLQRICDIKLPHIKSLRAHTRVSTNSSGIPDLVLAVEGSDDRKYLIVIENKLKAEEGADQTERYASQVCINELLKIVGWSNICHEQRFVFLTLFPDQEAHASRFANKPYENLLESIRGISRLEDSLAQMLLDAWASLLETFYSRKIVSPNELLMEKLQACKDDPLDGSYLFFRSFMSAIRVGYNLRVEETFRSAGRGRKYFGAVISKDLWHPAKMLKAGGIYELDAARNFNIHFEPQLNCLAGAMTLCLHYELNPYLNAKDVKSQIEQSKAFEAQYRAYERARKRFTEELQSRRVPCISIGGRTNQIASVALKLDDKTTIREARSKIESAIEIIAPCIDQILDERVASYKMNEISS